MQTSFGLVLRQRRCQIGFTPETFAREIGVETPVVTRVEQGLWPIPGEHLIPWANALRVTPEELVYLYLNLNAKKMMEDAGIHGHFKIVAVEGEVNVVPPCKPGFTSRAGIEVDERSAHQE